MKKRWIAAVLCLCALSPACKDEKPEEAAQPPKEEPKALPETAQQEVAAERPSEADVRAQLLPALASFPAVKLGEVRTDEIKDENGGLVIAARVQTVVEENLYTQEAAPEMLNEERKVANDAINHAMLPESHYLLQVGATTAEITDEDRRVRPLPEELQKLADELKQMAENPVYHLHTQAGTVVEIPATMKAHREGGHWVFTEINFGTEPLHSLVGTLPEAALPKGAAIVHEGFEAQQRAAMREKVAAFNEAAKPCIEGREEAARKRVLEHRTRLEEQERADAEKEVARATCRALLEKACEEVLKDGSVFSGEWKRGEVFGKMALRLARVQRYPDSLQFVGVVYDPDMPQAEVQVVGRCEAPTNPQEPVSVVVRLYSGRYDPDVATAEVFDAKDGLLRLKLDAEGKLTGQLTCEAWADTPDKAFELSLPFAPAKKTRRR